MKLKFFHASNGACSFASHIALEETGAAYEAVRLDFGKSEQRDPAYLSINPKGRVPALVTERGTLTETPAILTYIAQCFPAANLAPQDPFDFARMQAFMSYLCSTVHPAHAHKLRGARWSDDPHVIEALKVKVPQNMKDCFTLIEKEYFAGPWVMGDQFTVADPYLYAIATWLEGDGVDPHQFTKVYDHRQRMSARPSVQRILKANP